MVVTAQFCLYLFFVMSVIAKRRRLRRVLITQANIDITGRVISQSCLTLSAFPIVLKLLTLMIIIIEGKLLVQPLLSYNAQSSKSYTEYIIIYIQKISKYYILYLPLFDID